MFAFFFQKYFLIVLISLILLLFGTFLLKGTFYNPNYQIQTIDYPAATRVKYENTELFVLTSKLLRGQYYSALQIGGVGGLLSKIRQEYPFVRDVKVNLIDPQTVSVEYDFYEPDFLVKLGEKRF